MNTAEEEEFIRHNVFREELYVYAHLPRAEFQEKIEAFKKDYEHLLSNKKKHPLDITWSQFRKQIKSFF